MTANVLDSTGQLRVDPRAVGIQVEAMLREWDIPYEYEPAFNLDNIRSVEWTQVRQAIHLADPETVNEFRMQMAQGAVYPPIVIMEPNILVDGNTRLKAAKGLRLETFPAFVCRFNQFELAKSFAAAVNQLGGNRLTAAEAFDAVNTMMQLEMSDDAIARYVGRSVEAVRQMRRRHEFVSRTKAIPQIADLADQITQKSQVKLAMISHDPAFVEAVKMVAETGMKDKAVTEVVKAATTARTDAEAVLAVRTIREELAPAGPPPVKVTIPPEIRTANMGIGHLLSVADHPERLVDLVTSERTAAAIEKWQRVFILAVDVLGLYGVTDLP